MRREMVLAVGLMCGAVVATAQAQPIAPTRTFGAQIPSLVPPAQQGIVLAPKAKPPGVPTNGVGVANNPGLAPVPPLVPFVTRQKMPTIGRPAKRAFAADDAGGDMPDRSRYNTGYGLSWYDQQDTPDVTTKVPDPAGKMMAQPDRP